jgi:hypothetical protein
MGAHAIVTRPSRPTRKALSMDIVAIAIALAVFALLFVSVELLDRV